MPKTGFLGWAYVTGSQATINAGTDGQIAYYNGTGNTIDDTGKLLWDTSVNTLQVTGNLDISGTISAHVFETITVKNTTVSGSTKFGNDAADVHQFTGKIGIGTASPSNQIEIEGSSGDLIFEIDNNASNSANFQIQNGAGNARVDFVMNDGSANTTITMKGQKVGIGDTTPSYTLDVGGNAQVTTDLRVGDDLLLTSDSAILSLGADADATLTHDGTTGLTIAANPISIDATNALDLSSTTGDINFQDGGTTQLSLDMDGTAGEVIMQLKVDSDDFVFKQYDGTEVFRVEDNGAFDVAGGAGSSGVTITSAGQLTADGRILVDDTTEATSTTDGSLQTDGGLSVAKNAVIGGNLTVGDGGAEDQKIVLDGNATDYYLGLDDTDDTFKLGLGSAVGTNAALTINTSGLTQFPIATGVSASGPATFMGATVLGSTLSVSGSTTLGDALADNHFVTGSVYCTGSLYVSGSGTGLTIQALNNQTTQLSHGPLDKFTVDSDGGIRFDSADGGFEFAQNASEKFSIDINGTDDVLFKEKDGTEIFRIDESELSLLMASNNKLQFRDSALYLYSSADGALDAVSDGSFNVTVGAAGMIIKGTTPKLTIGDGGAEDTALVLDGNATDYYLGLDDTDDTFKLGLGSAVGTNAALTIDTTGKTRFPVASGVSGSGPATFMGATVLGSTLSVSGSTTLAGNLTVGDGGAEDQKIVLDGNATDYYLGLDDTDDTFKLGLGSTVGTNAAFTIDTTGKTKFPIATGISGSGPATFMGATVLGSTLSVSGSTTLAGNLTVGDGGAEDQKIVLDGNATDFYLGLDDTDDTFKLGLGSAVGTNAAFTIDTTGKTRFPIASGVSGSGPVTFMGAAVLGSTLDVSGSATLVGGSATQIALDINAANTTADVIDIAADAVTTANVLDVTADALTTGKILNLVSDSSTTDARTLVKIHQDHASAVNASCLHIVQDARQNGDEDDNLGAAVFIETGVATGDTALLALANTNADANGPIMEFLKEAESSAADDDDLGTIKFVGYDSGDNETTFAQILAESSDVTNNDEGGKLTFSVFAGGTAGTAAAANLFSIGGEDVANSTPCEVVVNDASIDCDFRVESNAVTHMLFVDAGNSRIGFANSAPPASLSIGNNFHTIVADATVTNSDATDDAVIAQLSTTKIPANAIVTKVAVTIKTQSSTSNAHNATILLSSANGVAADTAITADKIEILGAGHSGDSEEAFNSSSDGFADINLKAAVGTTFIDENIVKMGSTARYAYICNANGNSDTNASGGTVSVIIEYYGFE